MSAKLPDKGNPATPTARMRSSDPLHGITLQTIITDLEAWYGWPELGEHIKIRCFTHDPSIRSSLTFLRKTPWARKKVEDFYIQAMKRHTRKLAKKGAK